MPKSRVSAGWGPRVESVEDSADRVGRLLTALAELDCALTGWRGGGSKCARTVATTDHADLLVGYFPNVDGPKGVVVHPARDIYLGNS